MGWFGNMVLFFIFSILLFVVIGGDYKGWRNYGPINKVLIVIVGTLDVIFWIRLIVSWRGWA